MKFKNAVVLGLLLFFSLAATSFEAAAAEVREVRFWRAPDHSRVVLDLSSPVSHEVISLSNPNRLVLDIGNAKMGADTSALSFPNSPIDRLRYADKSDGKLRLVFDLNRGVQTRTFLLKAHGEQHDRLVVDFLDQEQSSAPRVVKSVSQSAQRDVVVAIDAGHGGEDPGAIGPGKLREKDVVYQIARRLEKKFASKKGYKVTMIRDGDYYVGLAKRRSLARTAQADFFVSIHADAFTDSRANGSSVYALSARGATSATARILAQSENQADLVGGVSLSDRDEVLAGVLTDLAMTATLDASLNVGSQILGEMGQISRLHSKRVEQAGFAVLKSPDIPSLLVETGFISNPHEASKLKTAGYQEQMAQAIFEGIDRYFRESPPPDTYFAAIKRGDAPTARGQVYVIARGDTLSGIAQRHNISVRDLQQHNGLSNSQIRIGQKIQIPAS
ncbi:N-acetylmuramoyl-L-alanine amidase [Spongiibacter sp. KMU-158]|uniref:N-acetylmuramoyl-L-alanine amidase AmiC n=1 Tax=Spongiibacter pelagi TaxID=2760804 RepID=A0A927C0G2_9GAMM|nr:N-acetylmuramoyl-L-alanine amidase [Spongiibacter pelagi]MBD2857903.1 N-acetylmuramoyl-L-alanine amidase [Spongiibacter pelagi]